MKRVVAVVVASASFAVAQPKSDPVKVVSPPMKGPPPETGADIAVPPAPSFEIATGADGRKTVQELRVHAKKHLGTLVEVEGTVTWVYNCVDALLKKGQTRAQIQKRIDRDPTQCERPKFFLGTTGRAPVEQSLWVVDVPRPPNKIEKARLPKDELAKWPAVPKVAVGDRVVVTGTFTQVSPHQERNSDGLVVFSAIAPAPAAITPGARIAPPDPPKVAVLARKKIERHPKDVAAGRDSIRLGNECVRAYGQQQLDDAIAKCTAAIATWGGNHLAYYALAGAHMGKLDWAAARDAMDQAISLAPDEPMYLMFYGIASYEAAIATEKTAEAKRQGGDPAQVAIDPSKLDFGKALGALQRAVQIEPKLWRAHYYIGRIYRDQGFAKAAASALRESISHGPTKSGPFIALGELYRRWDHPKHAAEIALLGTARISGYESADVWYVLGMTYDDQRDDRLAIQAFTQVLAADPIHAKALFQRGQVYVRQKERAKAKADLEMFVKVGSNQPSLSFALQQANKMLLDLAARR
jgi:tetratricopeptide (TPR) repeat protein